MKVQDPYWVATCGTIASWVYCLHVQAFRTDIEAALDAQDWETATEASGLMLKEIGICHLALRGYTNTPFESEVHLGLACYVPDLLDQMAEIPSPIGASEADARRAAAIAFAADDTIAAELPFEVPFLRSPQGFFPTLRMGSDLDRLRDVLGLPRSFWNNWIP